jgi:hypothetical protein
MGFPFPRRPFALALGLTATTVAAVFGACTDQYVPDQSTGGGGTTSSSKASTGGGGTGLGGINFDGPMCNNTCSNDLQSVVDCNGVVQMTCPSNQGCANGMCIDDPCMAAQLSKSSYGCDYWAVKTAERVQADGACFAAFVANTWTLPVNLTVEYQGMAPMANGSPLPSSDYIAIPQGSSPITYTPYDDATGLPVGQVAIVFLSRKPGGQIVACPGGLTAVGAETGVPIDFPGDTGNGVGNAFHISTNYPVVAYQMAAYGGGQAGVTSATLLLPTSAWDTNYIAINAYEAGTMGMNEWPALDIVAYQDNTVVTLLPNAPIAGPPDPDAGIPTAAPANVPVMYTLNTGEFLQIMQPQELTGSVIQSTLPVGVFGASACMEVPVGQFSCEPGEQQLPPVRALGNEYVAVRYRARGSDVDGGVDSGNEPTQWRVVGAVKNTTLTWQPKPPTGAPTTINLGEVVEFTDPGPFVVTSQDIDHPFYLGAYMTGGGIPPPTPTLFAGEGNPAWVNVVAPAQYLDHYVLFTDASFPETDLVLVRSPSKVDGSFAPVMLNCAGNATSQTVAGWQPIGSYEYTRVDLSTGDFMGVNGCTNGRQELLSALPFGVTVWGWGHAASQTANVSYAYPAGAGFQPINKVMIPPTPQ